MTIPSQTLSCLFIVCFCSHCVCGNYVWSLSCDVSVMSYLVLQVIMLGKKDPVALLLLCSYCHMGACVMSLPCGVVS